jgi:diguanylate cyclase (GGDEF)-like protein
MQPASSSPELLTMREPEVPEDRRGAGAWFAEGFAALLDPGAAQADEGEWLERCFELGVAAAGRAGSGEQLARELFALLDDAEEIAAAGRDVDRASVRMRSRELRREAFAMAISGLEAERSEQTAPEEAADGRLSGARILVVDDDPDHVEAVQMLLQARGCLVWPVLDAAAAQQAALMTLPELVLLDVGMPDLDGFTVAERLKADPRTSAIPIVFLSGRGELPQQLRGLTLGADDYVRKPFRAPELLARIEGALRVAADQDSVHAQAGLDRLTGVGNRHFLRDRLYVLVSSALHHGRPLTLLLADIDGLHRLNERFGHATGDEILVAVARVLRGQMRSVDVLARAGGDELALVLPDLSVTQVEAIAADAQAALADVDWPALLGGLRPTISMGIAELASECPRRLLARADEALHRAKQLGNGGVHALDQGYY